MTAVIGPVGIQDADLGHGRISLLFARKVGLDKSEIIKSHGKAKGPVKHCQGVSVHGNKAVEDSYVGSFGIDRFQSLGLFNTGLAGIHGVDAVALNPGKLIIRNGSCQDIGLCGPDDGLFGFIQKLHALHCGIRSLVELSGQGFYGKDSGPGRDLDGLQIQIVYGGLGKYGPAGLLEYLIGDIFHIIPDQNADIFDACYAKEITDILQQLACRNGIGSFLFHIDTSYATHV